MLLASFLHLIAGLALLFFTVHYIYYVVTALQRSTSNHMQTEDAKYIKKRWKGGTIEPHPTEKALIVNYKLEAAVFGEPGDPMLEDKKDCQRIIRLKSLNSKTDPAILAREVVEKCDLIHRSQLSDIEQIIYYLKNRKHVESSVAAANQRSVSRISGKISPMMEAEKASIRSIDEYIELLYEDLPEKVKGSRLILQLARDPDNLEELEKNEAVLSALSRVLREDWRRSLDLSTNIIYIFFCFSTYTNFHSVIVNYKIGSLCMDVIDFELRRYDQMKNDLDARKCAASTGMCAPDSAIRDREKEYSGIRNSTEQLDTIIDQDKPKEMEPPRRRIPELKQRPKSGNWGSYHSSNAGSGSANSNFMTSSLTKAHSMNSSYHDQLSNETVNGNCSLTVSTTSTDSLSGSGPPSGPQTPGSVGPDGVTDKPDPRKQKDDYDKINKQFKIFARKQEQLLRVAFYLLLNIAENVKLEEKMRKKSIVTMLLKALERQNFDLLVLVVTFLKKLSIVRDNKEEMCELNIVEKLPRLLQSQKDLVQMTLKLLFNLSFDARLRAKMIRVGLLPKLVTFLSDDKHHGIVTKILYHMSLDNKIKSMFTYTDCVPVVVDMLLLNLNQKSDPDLIALGINLALNRRNAALMIENNRLHNLMSRAFKCQDTMIMKMIRNISVHDTLRLHFVDFVGDLAKILTECDDEHFTVESLGILGNLALADLDYSQIIHNFNLIPLIRNMLVPGQYKDDMVLEMVVFLGTCASDESCAMLLCKADVMLSLIELLKAKQEDDEMVLQIVFVFQQVLRHESTRCYMIKETESPAYLIDLMHDKNTEIRKVCDFCLDIIAITDSEWASRITVEKFRNHNSQWLSMVDSQESVDDIQTNGPLEDEQSDLNAYLTSDYLDQLYNSGGDSNDDAESNKNRSGSAMSNYSRPVSRYSRSLEDLDTVA
ncbi:kinesin-associated protein 3 isoform X1 [Anopheles bellator]|uniref:kinesin-associated protein 3 isoform X1 n=1 Tax=Anopheles bellator TaxID=139047 RepID=UPI00264A1D56|nr:kinesin-associated protein 3 isoform X1 [Anopheles bellator]